MNPSCWPACIAHRFPWTSRSPTFPRNCPTVAQRCGSTLSMASSLPTLLTQHCCNDRVSNDWWTCLACTSVKVTPKTSNLSRSQD
ncbi:hypothetical protein JZ00_30530 [Pseudomonas frederiksbergensis]|uniref:Uncharacterized protein n=1 Tax=Pseudomonas frederiksbergensis TaxID=104087 RepID=A0A0U1PR12_9PSED|nr:hypothetical protein JZ00_30530 [Pseudomonas frederiksbergensis]